MANSNVIIGPWANSGETIIPPIYVILANGRPYMKGNAIRTYKTVKSATKSAAILIDYGTRYAGSRWAGAVIAIGEFTAVNVIADGGAE